MVGVGDNAFFESCPNSKLKRSAPLYVKAGDERSHRSAGHQAAGDRGISKIHGHRRGQSRGGKAALSYPDG